MSPIKPKIPGKRAPQFIEKERELMLQWRKEGKSYSAIGKLIGATKDRVKKFFKQIREKSELEQILGPPIVISRRIITAQLDAKFSTIFPNTPNMQSQI